MKYYAPSGTRLGLGDLAAGTAAAMSPARALSRFAAQLAQLTGAPHPLMFTSGRGALCLALGAMRRLRPARTVVVVPAYTCYSVAAAVARAGLTPRLVDVDPRTLDIDATSLASLETDDVLALVTTSLFGFPDDLATLERYARERGMYLIDDAAQALGARTAGRPAGGFGDVGILSFGKGKNITSITGGALLTRDDELGRAVAADFAALSQPSVARTASWLAQVYAYAAFLRPRAYDVVRRLPGLELGVTTYDPGFGVEKYPAALAGFGSRLATRLADITARRRDNALALARALADVPGVGIPVRPAGEQPAYLRQPVLLGDASSRAALLAACDAAGIGASASYPQALCDVPSIRGKLQARDLEMPGARRIARSLVTLPTHEFCPPDFAQHVQGVFARAAA